MGSYTGFYSNSLADVVAHALGRSTDLETIALYHNEGDGTFEDVAVESGLAHPLVPMGSNYGDIDGDGFPDAYFGTGEPSLATLVPNRMFHNVGGRRFEDVTAAGGFGHLQKGHGIAFGDIDNDGDQDVYAVMGGAYAGDVYPNVLFENPGTSHHWLTLELQGVHCNRSALGARVRVVVEAADGGERAIHALVGTGASFGSSSLRQEIGLGEARAIRRVEVRWPGAREAQVVEDVPLDRFVRLRQGEPRVRILERPVFSLGGIRKEDLRVPGVVPGAGSPIQCSGAERGCRSRSRLEVRFRVSRRTLAQHVRAGGVGVLAAPATPAPPRAHWAGAIRAAHPPPGAR